SKKRFRKLIASVMSEERMIFISTHQIRDIENMIDQVIIVDNGDLLLNASVAFIGERLCFKTVDEIAGNDLVLYEEESLKGKSIVIENTRHEDSKVNLEHLFNAITDNPVLAKNIFKN
ncbi:MAG: ABC transporter ATP-binding protein, partial [Ferruginibacter sp.]